MSDERFRGFGHRLANHRLQARSGLPAVCPSPRSGLPEPDRLSVLNGEPGCLGMSEGAATRQETLSCLRRRAMTKPQGPAS